MIVSARLFYLLLALVPLLPITAQTKAPRYEMRTVTAERKEMTRSLDASPDTAAAALLAPYKLRVDSLMAPVLGMSEVYMRAGRPESPLSNWVADVLRETSAHYGRKADVGLCNMGGLRSSMPKGKVTRGDVIAIAPFENRLCILSLRGSDLLELMRQIASVGGEGVSGLQLAISKDGRLLQGSVNGAPVEPDRIYTVATLDYLAEGNDKMTVLKKAVSRQVTNHLVRNVLMNYIVAQNELGRRLFARTEGRITVVEP